MHRICLVFSLLLIGLAWRVGLHITNPPHGLLALAFGLTGIGLLGFCLDRLIQLDKCIVKVSTCWLIIVCAGSVLASIDLRNQMASLHLSCAVFSVLLLICQNLERSAFRSRIYSLWIASVIASLSGISTLALRRFGWWFHDISIQDRLGMLFRFFPGTEIINGCLAISTRNGVREIRLGFELLGLYEIWLIGAALVSCLFVLDLKMRLRWLLASLATLVVYGVARGFVGILTAIEFGSTVLLWDSRVVSLTWIPVALLLPKINLTRQSDLRVPKQKIAALIISASVLFGIFLGLDDPGILKMGRVVVDEAHADWEWTDSPFDTTAFGMRAEYNYACLYEYLSNYYSVSRNSAPITPEVLKDVDVLVLKTPTQPYSKGEIEAILEFVKQGGGLLMISDHTNLFGMSSYLNEIATRFGIKFRYDDTFDLPTGDLSRFEPNPIGRHTALRMVDRLDFLTSCSIHGSPLIAPIIVGYGLGSEDADYGHPNFFGNIAYDLGDRFGLFLQAASRRFGKGRVILFTDSTCFSNFCLFGSDMAAMILGFIDYLNREGRRWTWLWSIVLIGTASMASGLWLVYRQKSSGLKVVIPVLFAILIGYWIGKVVTLASYGNYQPIPPSRMVVFDTEHTDATFSRYIKPQHDMRAPDYTGFFVNTLRIGLYPRPGTVDDLAKHRPLGFVVIEPNKAYSSKEIKAIMAYIESGGRLLVIDSVRNGNSTANQILGPLGLSLLLTSRVKADSSGFSAQPYLEIVGGSRLKVANSPPGQIVYQGYGQGSVLVVTDGFQLSGINLAVLIRGTIPSHIRCFYSWACEVLRIAFNEDQDLIRQTYALASDQVQR